MDINQKITEELGVKLWQVEAAVKLIDEGNTIPFIARYRKEATGTLDDEQLRKLYERLVYLRNLEEKKEQVLASIEEQGKLTEELKKQILEAQTQVVVEDLYRPYRPKRRTRATIAKEKGLEPLANILMLQMTDKAPEKEAEAFVSEEKGVADVKAALDGAKEVKIFNFDDKFYERAESTKAKLAEKCPDCVVTVDHLEDADKLAQAVKECDILINGTIMGMKPYEDVTLVDKSLFHKDLVVADTVYNPEKTKMILEAEEAGCKAIGGVGMLQQQGAVNYELFVGKEMPLAEYQEFQKQQAK